MRKVLLNKKLTTITVFHEQHITGPMITYIVVTSPEITKKEYSAIMQEKMKNRPKKLDDAADIEDGQLDPSYEAILEKINNAARQTRTPIAI